MTTFTGTSRLLRLAIRRDRVTAPAWLVAVGVLAFATVGSVVSLYTTAEERLSAATFTAANVPSRAFNGPASGTDVGAIAIVEAYIVVSILVALMASLMVIRHTRKDEEAGRAELLGSAVTGRHAALTAALSMAFGTSVAAGAVMTGALLANSLPLTGSLAAGASIAGVGVVLASVAAVTAQVFSSSRAATASSGAVLGAAFLLRAVGDAAGEVAPSGVELISAWPTWLSPLGWGQQVRPFSQDNWEVLGLFLVLTVILMTAAAVLITHRDIGAGMVAVRPGPATAAASLRSPLGLAWRLQRPSVIGWIVGLAVVGAAFGAVGDGADEIAEISEQLAETMSQLAADAGMTELFFAFTMGFLGIAVTAFTVQSLLRLRTEESEGRVEPLLAASVSRVRWMASHVTIAAGGTVLLLAVTGLSATAGYGALTSDWSAAFGLTRAALAQVPAALALGAMVAAAFAFLPRWSVPVAWSLLAAALVAGQLGALLDLPQQILNLSPFTHIPPVPAVPVAWSPILWLLASTAILSALALMGFRRRDLSIAA